MAALATLALLCVVLLSPLILSTVYGGVSQQTLDRFDKIGAMYGAASALTSSLAIGGVLTTPTLQIREARRSRQQALRTLHVDLLKLSLSDAALMESWGPFSGQDDPVAQRQHIYINMIVQHWRLMLETDAISLEQLAPMANELMAGLPGQRYWLDARGPQLLTARTDAARSFIKALDDAYLRA